MNVRGSWAHSTISAEREWDFANAGFKLFFDGGRCVRVSPCPLRGQKFIDGIFAMDTIRQ